MPIDPVALGQLLRLPAAAGLELEPLGPAPSAPVRASAHGHAWLVRALDDEAVETHAEVLEALGKAGFAFAPRLVAAGFGLAAEEWVEGLSFLAIEPPPGALEAAVDAIATLHALDLRAGLRQGLSPAATLPPPEPPLHRLGFAAHEREVARPHLAAAHTSLLASPFGFVHGAFTASRVMLTREGPRIVSFGAAGFGPQLFDLAAFLLTSGAEAPARAALAARYAAVRGLPTAAAATWFDDACLLWGIDFLLGLPRRLIEALGDDVRSAAIELEAARVQRALPEPGASPHANAARAALWLESRAPRSPGESA